MRESKYYQLTAPRLDACLWGHMWSHGNIANALFFSNYTSYAIAVIDLIADSAGTSFVEELVVTLCVRVDHRLDTATIFSIVDNSLPRRNY